MSRVVAALETSSRRGSVAVRVGDEHAEEELASSRRHATDLVPTLDALLARLGARPADLSAVLVGTGPGSYTGTRVAVATALGISRGSGADLRGVPSFDALAWEALGDKGGEAALLLDARAGALYFAHYRRDGDVLEIPVPPCLVAPKDLRLPPECAVLADDAAVEAAGLDDAARARVKTGAVATARAVLELGERRLAELGPEPADAVRPLYLRAFGERP